MEVVIICLAAFILLVLIDIFIKLGKQPKTLGKIIITDEDSLYVELNNYDSMEKIHNSKVVAFEVWREKQISPK